ncbi:MAG TPA: DNA polymerase III subunit delta' [Stellaceae bacterium]|nr:DNA polymerase III subunit delta' [Stellaceae bacterium]
MSEDELPDPLAPRRNPDLVGHGAAEHLLAETARAGRMPHAVILGGPRGIGKATLAYRFARWLLAGQAEAPSDMLGKDAVGLFGPAEPPPGLFLDPSHVVARRVAAAGHADLLTIERGWDAKRKKLRGEIVIEDVREIGHFLHLTSAEGGWRIVVVDSADEMNRNAANALLKILEEPPRRALLLLVCHAPGRLLPTIRSRCRMVNLQPLALEEVTGLVAAHLPEASSEERAALAALSDGSVGKALDLAEAGGLELYRQLIGLLNGLPQLDGLVLHQLADKLARPDAVESYATFFGLLVDWLQRMVVTAAGGGERIPEVVQGEADLASRLAASGRLDRWVDVWENLRALFAQADSVNLDRKQVVLDAFFALEAAASA